MEKKKIGAYFLKFGRGNTKDILKCKLKNTQSHIHPSNQFHINFLCGIKLLWAQKYNVF